MKQAKKLASLLLALVMVLALATTAFAAGTNSITVNGAQGGETYKLYKLLNLTVSEDQKSYSYSVNDEWKSFFTTGAGKDYVTIDTSKYVTWKEGKGTAADMETFGKAAATAATGKAVTDTKTPESDGSFDFSNLEPGYYLITSTNGTLAIVDTTPTKPDATVTEKNPNPTIEKKVQEDSNNQWLDENSAQIGDTVNFKSTIQVRKGALSYVVHDKMDDGLSFNADSVAISGLTNGTDYTVVSTGLMDDCTFEIRFTQNYLNNITEDTPLTITYNAVLNEHANITEGETNQTKITWGNTNSTEWDTTITKTYQFALLKYDATDTDKNPLAGATFQLKDAADKVVKLIKVSDTEYRVANGSEAGAVENFTTVADGNIVIKGVDLDDYTLVETVAPDGYNKLQNPVTVTVNNTNNLVIEVPNASGTELPSTGGIGTTIFYVLGSILVIGAAVLLVTKKRMGAKD